MTFSRLLHLAGMILLLSACATPDVQQEDEAVRDYIAAAELEETDRIRTGSRANIGFTPLNEYFVIFANRDEHYLAEMRRRCYELLDNSRIVPDVRRDSTGISARFDTFRGCLIDKIYLIDEAQAQELKNLGDAPGGD